MNDEAKAAEVAALDGGKNLLSSKDLVLGTALAIIMGTVFAKLGGRPLLVTFVPGLIVGWILFVRIFLKMNALPAARAMFPIYFLTLGCQFIHFAEEYLTVFIHDFPNSTVRGLSRPIYS